MIIIFPSTLMWTAIRYESWHLYFRNSCVKFRTNSLFSKHEKIVTNFCYCNQNGSINGVAFLGILILLEFSLLSLPVTRGTYCRGLISRSAFNEVCFLFIPKKVSPPPYWESSSANTLHFRISNSQNYCLYTCELHGLLYIYESFSIITNST